MSCEVAGPNPTALISSSDDFHLISAEQESSNSNKVCLKKNSIILTQEFTELISTVYKQCNFLH